MSTINNPLDLNARFNRYLDFLQNDPLNLSLISEVADLAYQLGSFEQAQKFIEEGLCLAPNKTNLIMLKGLIALHERQFEQAETLFKLILEHNPLSTEALYNLAYTLLLQDRYIEAEPFAQQAATHLNELPQAAELYTNTLHFLGKVEEAIGFAENVLLTHPELNTLHGLLSALYTDQENWQKAKQHAQKAFEVEPNNTDALTVFGTLMLAEQNAPEAQSFFEKAIINYPTNGRAWAGQAMAYMLQGNLTKAEENLKQALQYMPKHVGTWQALSWCQILQEHLADAQTTLEHSLQLEHNFAETHGTLAVLFILKGDLDQAEKQMTIALKLDAKCFSGLFAKTLMLEAQGNASTAQKLMQKLQQTAVLPDGTSIEQAVARMLKKQQ